MRKILSTLLLLPTLISSTGFAVPCEPWVAGEYRIKTAYHDFWVRLHITSRGYLKGDMFLSNASGSIDEVLGSCNIGSPGQGVFSFQRVITSQDSNGETPSQRWIFETIMGPTVTGRFVHTTPTLGSRTESFSGYKR